MTPLPHTRPRPLPLPPAPHCHAPSPPSVTLAPPPFPPRYCYGPAHCTAQRAPPRAPCAPPAGPPRHPHFPLFPLIGLPLPTNEREEVDPEAGPAAISANRNARRCPASRAGKDYSYNQSAQGPWGDGRAEEGVSTNGGGVRRRGGGDSVGVCLRLPESSETAAEQWRR